MAIHSSILACAADRQRGVDGREWWGGRKGVEGRKAWGAARTETLKYNFPSSSAAKESACNAGDPSSIPELGSSPAEGIGYPFQYSWASLLVAQLVKNLPAMQETCV